MSCSATTLPGRNASVPALDHDSWTDQGLRDTVGAAHRPLPELLGMLTRAGLRLDRFAEGGGPTPTVLGVRAVKSGSAPTGRR